MTLGQLLEEKEALIRKLEAGLESIKAVWLVYKDKEDLYDEGYEDALKYCHDLADSVLTKGGPIP